MFFVGAFGFYGGANAQDVPVVSADENKPFWETEKVPDKLVKRYKRRLPFFTQIDRDKDWILQEREIEAYLLQSFKQYDADKNGLWDAQELGLHSKAFSDDREEAYGSTSDARVKRYNLRIDQADKNEDKNLSWSEYYTFYRGRFYRMDSDENDEVEYREFRLIDDKLSPGGGVDVKHVDVPEYK